MLLKLLLLIGGITIFGSMIYDRFTGKRMTRRIVWPLVGTFTAVLIAIAVRAMVK